MCAEGAMVLPFGLGNKLTQKWPVTTELTGDEPFSGPNKHYVSLFVHFSSTKTPPFGGSLFLCGLFFWFLQGRFHFEKVGNGLSKFHGRFSFVLCLSPCTLTDDR
jgi:hypothetical protein